MRKLLRRLTVPRWVRQWPNADERQLLEHLYLQGGDMRKPREVAVGIGGVKTKKDKEAIIHALMNMGWTVSSLNDHGKVSEGSRIIRASHPRFMISARSLEEMNSRMYRLARLYGVTYLGWEASVLPSENRVIKLVPSPDSTDGICSDCGRTIEYAVYTARSKKGEVLAMVSVGVSHHKRKSHSIEVYLAGQVIELFVILRTITQEGRVAYKLCDPVSKENVRAVTRQEALEHPRMQEVWRIVDALDEYVFSSGVSTL